MRVNGEISDWFSTIVGVLQMLSPLLFIISLVCTVVQYAVLEAMTRVYGKTENSTPRKHKMDKDIQTPPRIYDYVAELSCCAKSEQNRLTQFCWGNMGSLTFFLTHTINHTNSSILSTDHNKNLSIANRSRVSCAHNTFRTSIGLSIIP